MEVRWLEWSELIFLFNLTVSTQLYAVCFVEKCVFVNNLDQVKTSPGLRFSAQWNSMSMRFLPVDAAFFIRTSKMPLR